MKLKLLVIACLIFTGSTLFAQSAYQWKSVIVNGYTNKYVTNDPSNSRFYFLKNGLTLILSPNNKESNIHYFADKKLGYDYDSRIDLYKELKPVTFETINAFPNQK
jgi:hypothetical protein